MSETLDTEIDSVKIDTHGITRETATKKSPIRNRRKISLHHRTKSTPDQPWKPEQMHDKVKLQKNLDIAIGTISQLQEQLVNANKKNEELANINMQLHEKLMGFQAVLKSQQENSEQEKVHLETEYKLALEESQSLKLQLAQLSQQEHQVEIMNDTIMQLKEQNQQLVEKQQDQQRHIDQLQENKTLLLQQLRAVSKNEQAEHEKLVLEATEKLEQQVHLKNEKLKRAMWCLRKSRRTLVEVKQLLFAMKQLCAHETKQILSCRDQLKHKASDLLIQRNSKQIHFENTKTQLTELDNHVKLEKARNRELQKQHKKALEMHEDHIEKLQKQLNEAKNQLEIMVAVRSGMASEIYSHKTGKSKLELQNSRLKEKAKEWERQAKLNMTQLSMFQRTRAREFEATAQLIEKAMRRHSPITAEQLENSLDCYEMNMLNSFMEVYQRENAFRLERLQGLLEEAVRSQEELAKQKHVLEIENAVAIERLYNTKKLQHLLPDKQQ